MYIILLPVQMIGSNEAVFTHFYGFCILSRVYSLHFVLFSSYSFLFLQISLHSSVFSLSLCKSFRLIYLLLSVIFLSISLSFHISVSPFLYPSFTSSFCLPLTFFFLLAFHSHSLFPLKIGFTSQCTQN